MLSRDGAEHFIFFFLFFKWRAALFLCCCPMVWAEPPACDLGLRVGHESPAVHVCGFAGHVHPVAFPNPRFMAGGLVRRSASSGFPYPSPEGECVRPAGLHGCQTPGERWPGDPSAAGSFGVPRALPRL